MKDRIVNYQQPIYEPGTKVIAIEDDFLVEGEMYQIVFNDMTAWQFYFCRADAVIADTQLSFLDIDEFPQYFITLAQHREKQINEILN